MLSWGWELFTGGLELLVYFSEEIWTLSTSWSSCSWERNCCWGYHLVAVGYWVVLVELGGGCGWCWWDFPGFGVCDGGGVGRVEVECVSLWVVVGGDGGCFEGGGIVAGIILYFRWFVVVVIHGGVFMELLLIVELRWSVVFQFCYSDGLSLICWVFVELLFVIAHGNWLGSDLSVFWLWTS